MKSGGRRGYLMVIHTFRQPGASEPADAQRLASSSAPFVVQRRRVRWHAGVPYGYPHLSSTKVTEFDGIGMMFVVRFWLLWKFLQVLLLSSRDGDSDDMRGYLMVIRTFCQPRRTSSMVSGWCWSSDSDYFENFCIFFFHHLETFKPDNARDSSLLGRDNRVRQHVETLWLSRFIAFEALKFCWRPWRFFFSKWQVPLVGIFIGQVMFRSNEISVLSLVPFYHQ